MEDRIYDRLNVNVFVNAFEGLVVILNMKMSLAKKDVLYPQGSLSDWKYIRK